jgi:ribosomal protein S6
MEASFNLEVKYMALAMKDDKIDEIEVALSKLHEVLISTRSHISLVQTLEAKQLASQIDKFIEQGSMYHTNALQRNQPEIWLEQTWTLPQTARKLLIKIYVQRYSNKKTGKNLKLMLESYNNIVVKQIKGQATDSKWSDYFWSSIEYIKTKLRGIPSIVQEMWNTVKSTFNRITQFLSSYLADISLMVVGKIVLAVLLLGLFGFGAYTL